MGLTAAIVEDERIARERLVDLLLKVPSIELSCECRTGREALYKIPSIKPDVVFLDVNLKDANGLEIWQSIAQADPPLLIVVSAHHSYATMAFEAYAIDYLLKPFHDSRFYQSVNRILAAHEKKVNLSKMEPANLLASETISEHDFLRVREHNKLYFVKFSEIMYFIASGHYIQVFTKSGEYIYREKLNRLDSFLNSHNFLRIHRSTIISLDYIKDLIHSDFGELDIKMKDNKLLRISRGYKTHFLKKVGLAK